MPIGFSFKALGRRKSSTPVSEFQESVSPVHDGASTFRVIPRASHRHAVNEDAAALDKPLPASNYRRTWSEEDNSSSNRASDSTASTTNSRTETYNDRARTQKKAAPHMSSRYPFDHDQREKSLEQSSTSHHAFLDMPTSSVGNEDFGNMFDNTSSPQQKVYRPGSSGPGAKLIVKASFEEAAPAQYSRYTKTPPPLHLRQSGDLNPSPYSLQSRNSRDGLLSSGTPSPSQETPPPPPPPHKSPHKSPPKKSHTFDIMGDAYRSNATKESHADSWGPSIVRRTESTESFIRSGADGDNDAKMVRNSILRRDTNDLQAIGEVPVCQSIVNSSHASLQPPIQSSHPSSSSNSFNSPSISSSASSLVQGSSATSSMPKPTTPMINQPIPPSNNTTPRANPARQYEGDSDSEDEPLAHTLHRMSSNPRLSMIAPTIGSGGRMSVSSSENPKRYSSIDNLKLAVVTPTESAVPRHDDRLSSGMSPAPHLLGDSLPHLETGSLEKTMHLQRPRLSMASQNAPLLTLPKHGRAISSTSRSSEDDDDVPLALLPASNSPLRGRTPDLRFSQPSLMGQARTGAAQGAPSASGGRPASTLPPFARRLPQDPYHSAGGAMDASRETLLLNRPGSMFPPGQSPVPGMPPGGLVGVIAEEERTKSWRRAGGQAQLGPIGISAGMSMGMGGPTSIPGLGSGLMGPQMMPGIHSGEQTQFNQQLVQLVQQQSIMLQQMQAMMMQQNQGAHLIAGYANADFMQSEAPQLRPASILSQGQRTRSMIDLGRPAHADRAMSMIDSSASYAPNWAMSHEPLISSATSVRGMANGYAASVAPSERSTMGQPNRYRPVTNPAAGADMYSSYGQFNRTSMADVAQLAPADMTRDEDSTAKKKKSGFFQAMIHPRGSRNSDMLVEDEEDWGKFARKRRSAMPS